MTSSCRISCCCGTEINLSGSQTKNKGRDITEVEKNPQTITASLCHHISDSGYKDAIY